MLFLPLSTYQSCSVGTENQCKDAEFAPGTNFAGEGFDITEMKRKGAYVIDMQLWKHKNGTCNLCTNPHMAGKKQKLPLSVVEWKPNKVFTKKVSSQLHLSSESLINSSSSEVENNWHDNLDVNVKDKSKSFILVGTQSELAEFSMEKTKNDRLSFTSHSMSREYYSYQVSRPYKLHKEFDEAVNKLPKNYSPETKQRYYKLIGDFGTHYITKVKLGGSVQTVTSIRKCLASLQSLSITDVLNCLDVEASTSIGVGTFKTQTENCKKAIEQEKSKFSFFSLFSDRATEIKGGHTTEPDLLFSAVKDKFAYKDWANTLAQHPEVVSYSLAALHELLPVKNPVRKNLRSAISHYILEKGLMSTCSEPCQAGMKSNSRDPCVCQCQNDPAVNGDCCPTHKGMARAIITIQRGTDLWGDLTTATDGYVKVFFNGHMVLRSHVINNNNNPHWDKAVDLGTLDLTEGRKLRFEVWDQDSDWDDDLLGECEKFLHAGVKQQFCSLSHGWFYFKWEVRCAQSLSGEVCLDYDPSPMSPSLKSMYVSRHSQPIPKAILLSMGVFVDNSSSISN
ncbi:hypothetical protein LDENG_00279760 [Lucifuga dentata]|nr:hypothetical protein LDENG_00279760 [Lucifuga dentata]